MAIVKADGYGHGMLEVAVAALQGGAKWLGVATLCEGAELRSHGITAPIALLSSAPPEAAVNIAVNELTPMVGDVELAAALASLRRTDSLSVHLDIDTGIGRSGVLPDGAIALWRQCVRAGLEVSGISTHFADADGASPDLTIAQWKCFDETRRALEAEGARFQWSHAGNSPTVLNYAANGCNLARPGLLLYGIGTRIPVDNESSQAKQVIVSDRDPSYRSGLRAPITVPALALFARVGAVRNLPAGHPISYGATHRLRRRSQIATILIGYGDGYPRRLSNCGEVLLRGHRAPILGRVCMDQTVVDVSDIPGVAAGDVATCIGSDGEAHIGVESIARLIETTDHEVTTCLTGRLPRVYRNGAFS